uniref:Cytochrome c oxidase subunit 2 n=1 Tax=Neomaskellia andropogonis TaxID=266944 RepID=Q697G5_NEOAD|nr:cytochrome oxidase subunit II [Neomaskellia andropogonis]
MNSWMKLSYQDSSSFLMEHLGFFFDFSCFLILVILIFVVYMMSVFLFSNLIYFYVLDNQFLEVIWTFMPFFILIFLALPSIRILYLMDESSLSMITCKVIGHQWFWSYELSDFMDLGFDSYMIINLARFLEVDNCLVLPFLVKIRLLVTSSDVLHSWAVPSLGVKVDAVPGRLNQASLMMTRLGKFYGQCSEICGANHSYMPIVVDSVNLSLFKVWMYLNSSKSLSCKHRIFKSSIIV